MLAKYIMYNENLNFVMVSPKGRLKSSARGIKPIYENYLNNKEYFFASSVADRVIGKAAAILLVAGGVKEVYTDLISQSALDYFEERLIEVSYAEKTELILNRDRTDLCPMEKLSLDNPSSEELIERLGDFFAEK